MHLIRVLINLEKVGDFGHRPDDIICLGRCDEIIRELARELGWEEELLEAWESTAGSVELDKEKAAIKEKEQLQTEVDKLASKVESSLTLTEKSAIEEEQVNEEPRSPAEYEEPVVQLPTNTQKEEKPLIAEGDKAPSSPQGQAEGEM